MSNLQDGQEQGAIDMPVIGDQSRADLITRLRSRAWAVLLVPAMVLSQMSLQHVLDSPDAYHHEIQTMPKRVDHAVVVGVVAAARMTSAGFSMTITDTIFDRRLKVLRLLYDDIYGLTMYSIVNASVYAHARFIQPATASQSESRIVLQYMHLTICSVSMTITSIPASFFVTTQI
jgi:hypothetical protein